MREAGELGAQSSEKRWASGLCAPSSELRKSGRVCGRGSARARAFTLTELLVVIAILVVLAALLFPVFARSKARGKLAACEAKLHQAALGIQMYRVDHDGQAWLQYSGDSGGYTTAGRFTYPWNFWLPAEPYLKDGTIVWCPEPPRDEVTVYNMFTYQTILEPGEQPKGTVRTWYPVEPEAGRVVSFCGNHATKERERPDPKRSGHRTLWKGTYPIVREDGGTQLVQASQIEPWYLWEDRTWHPDEPAAPGWATQVWRFPKEPWPPVVPF
ncbi:MAG: type II secretion system protein [Fimbriimonas sp.]